MESEAQRGMVGDFGLYGGLGGMDIVALALPCLDGDSEKVADFIAGLVALNQNQKHLLVVAKNALDSILDEGLNFSTEQDAEHAIASISVTMS